MLSDAQLTDRLMEAGFRQPAAEARARTFASCVHALDPGAAADQLHALWVPGRIEVLGKHTDYAGGRSLLCATDLGAAFVSRPRHDHVVAIRDLRSGETDQFVLDPELTSETGDWTNYPRTAARRLAANFGIATGADIVFESNLPLAAGMSSSSALIVAFATILKDINGVASHPAFVANVSGTEDEAGYLGTVENGQTFGTLEGHAGVGTFGGSEDHTAILCSSPGTLKQYAFCPVRHEATVPFPEDWVFVVASSGIVAEKTGAALERFNRASRLASCAASVVGDALGQNFPHLAAAITHDRDAAREILSKADRDGFSAKDFFDRFDQFSIESEEIIPAAVRALREGDTEHFGAEVTRSQQTGAALLGNQVEQTVWLAERAVQCGAVTASAFGAGFGGSVYAIVDRADAGSFLERWRSDYHDRFFGQSASSAFVVTEPGPPVLRVLAP